MIVSPSNIIEGLIKILEVNAESINELIRYYRKTDTLHLFKGTRKTLPMSAFPSLEFEPASGNMEWTTTSAMEGTYSIDCVLTVNCGTSVELGVEYISELTRKIVQIYNYPQNMSWVIPDEYVDKEKKIGILCQFSDIRSVEYGSSKDFAIRAARWSMECKTVEGFPHPGSLLGPVKVDWKTDVLPTRKVGKG